MPTIQASASNRINEHPKNREMASFRPDIQGLRALAIVLVLLFHAGAPFLQGGYIGVDVFFVISGYLITGLLLKEMRATGRISLSGFYARRVRRILPAATLTIICIAAMTIAILPRTRWAETAWQMAGSATYVVNWILADSVNYLNAERPPTSVQNFWTLAVEEQFYIVWPLIIAGLVFCVNVWMRKSQRITVAGLRDRQYFLLAAILAIALPSFAWSLYYTGADPGRAYFVTTTRVWELGIGAIVAVVATRLINLRRLTTICLGWFGLGTIIAASVLYSPETPFPGYAALAPTLGASAIIIAGLQVKPFPSVGVALSILPMRLVGNVSYSLYLWHWPFIVVAAYLLDGLAFWEGLIVVILASIPAILSYRYMEVPIMKSVRLNRSNTDTLLVGASLMLVSVLASFSLLLVPDPITQTGYLPLVGGGNSVTSMLQQPMGAELLAQDPSFGTPTDTVNGLVLGAVAAAQDVPHLYKLGCHQQAGKSAPEACISGDGDGTFKIAVVGDSHAAQWVPALDRLGSKNGWKIASYTKSACPLLGSAISLGSAPDISCLEWNRNVLSELTGPGRADLVIVSSSIYVAYDEQLTGAPVAGSISEGLRYVYETLKQAGISVAVLADTPRPGIDVPECISANPEQISKCAFPRTEGMQNGLVAQQAALVGLQEVPLIDLNNRICPQELCSAVIGNVVVYRDSNHVTSTYIRSLSSDLGSSLIDSQLVPPLR